MLLRLSTGAAMTARVAGWMMAVCVTILLADYVVASRRAPLDERMIKGMQAGVKSDAAIAPRLGAEQKRITAARLARRRRDQVVGWVLIGAGALFLLFVPRAGMPVPSAPIRPGRSVTHSGTAAARQQAGTDTGLDLGFIDELVQRTGRGKEAAIPILQAIQEHYRYLPDEALRRVCEVTEITPAQIAGTSSFYGQFRRSPVGKHIVRVCHGTACHVAGARQVTEELRRQLAIPEGADTDGAREFTLEEVACLGCCSLAPVLMVDGRTAGRLTPSSAIEALES